MNKLKLKFTNEDTVSIPTKTDYFDGKSRIHYFGIKPELPKTLNNYLNNKKSMKRKNYTTPIKEDASNNYNNVFNLNKPGDYVKDFLTSTKVGNVTGYDYQKFEKGREGIIKYMTGDEYIQYCMKNIFNNNSYQVCVTNATDKNNINKYAENMLNGHTFPIPYLDFVNKQQEGRHRALAYKQAFGTKAKLTVLCIYKSNPTDDEIMEYVLQKWGQKHAEWGYEYVASRFRTLSEINTYLGKEDEDVSEEEVDIDEDELNDAFISDIDSSDGMDGLEELSKKSGIPVVKLASMSSETFIKLVNKYL